MSKPLAKRTVSSDTLPYVCGKSDIKTCAVLFQFQRVKERQEDRKAGRHWAESSAFAKLFGLLRGSAIGSTPDFESGYPGSSPGPGATPTSSRPTAHILAPMTQTDIPKKQLPIRQVIDRKGY
jgi:hypothetical protein